MLLNPLIYNKWRFAVFHIFNPAEIALTAFISWPPTFFSQGYFSHISLDKIYAKIPFHRLIMGGKQILRLFYIFSLFLCNDIILYIQLKVEIFVKKYFCEYFIHWHFLHWLEIEFDVKYTSQKEVGSYNMKFRKI